MKWRKSVSAQGLTQLEFEDDTLFDKVGHYLTEEAGAKVSKCIESADQVWMDFELGNFVFTLHWDNYAGLFLKAGNSSSEAVLLDIGEKLTGK
jgi:hypothetical protein